MKKIFITTLCLTLAAGIPALMLTACSSDDAPTSSTSARDATAVFLTVEFTVVPTNTDMTVEAKVLDENGDPISGKDVYWSYSGPGGSFNPNPSTTNANGIATTDFSSANCGSGYITAKAKIKGNWHSSAKKVWVGADSDGDGIIDCEDNCPNTPNSDQADCDGDGKGDACEADSDGDGIPDDCDNCPNTSNPDQEDKDDDGVGAACDADDNDDTVQ